MESLLRDLRFAARGLARTPGFTLAAVLALALGIGATTAIFSVVHAVLLRSLGWGEESRLVSVRGNFYAQNLLEIWISPQEYKDLQASPLLETIGVYYDDTAALQGERAERVKSGYATGSFFTTLGVPPAFGRVFTPEEDLRGNDGVTLVSWAAWQKRFGGDPAAVGTSVTLDGRPRTIVGILPASFRWQGANEFYIPFGFTADQAAERGSRYLNPVARLKPGLTLEAARRGLDQLSGQIREANPGYYPQEARWALSMEPLRDRFVGSTRQPLLILFGAVLFVLLIACANVANLLLARGAARAREMAVRSALGGSRARLVRQLLTESGVLAILGAALGVCVAVWALDALLAAAPASVQQFADVRVSRAVLGFAAGMVVLTTLFFGLAPALQSTRLDLAQSLKDGGRDTGGPRAGRLRSGLVVAQVALSLMLLIGAALLLRSFATLLQVKPGFTTEGVIAAQISLGGPEYDEKQPAQARYWAEAVRRVAVLPGVTAAGAVNLPPLEGRTDRSYEIEGYVRRPGEPHTDDEFRQATQDYFKALGIAVVQGREFTAGDDAKAPLVALVNEAWVRRYFPGQDVIGKRLRYHGGEKEAPWRSIVGVVGDAHEFGFDKPTPPVYFVPLAQFAGSRATLMVRTAGSLQSRIKPVREALVGIDPTQPVDRVDAFESHVEGALAARRFPLQLLGAFAGLALVLSALGIYGVTAYGVTRRTKEIGVRIAIGAQRTDVLRMVMSGAARLAAIGVGIGVVGALVGARLLSSQLYGVSARDPLVYAGISLLLALVALFASLLPALRATRVDPMSALRSE
jgi:predicted permease